MSDAAKIVLSGAELNIARDTEWILTKQRIIEKVFHLFNLQVPAIKNILGSTPGMNDPGISSAVPRIFKGENYRQLPYVILDYPAVFKNGDIFAIRTMFWWGNFFSVVLVMSGKYLEAYKGTLIQNLQAKPGDFYVCIGDSPWEHHFGADNFVAVAGQDLQSLPPQDFLKIGLKYDLQHWNIMPSLLGEGLIAISKLFVVNFPGDETGL